MPEFDYNTQSGRISPVVAAKPARPYPFAVLDKGVKGENGESLIGVSAGVGEKLRIAVLADRYDTLGVDCVASCVNGIICSGAAPLFFHCHISVGARHSERERRLLAEIESACETAGCSFLGHSFSRLGGILPSNACDISGFCAGVAKKDAIIGKSGVRNGDAIIGIASSGLHLNGFGLVAAVFDAERRGVREYISELGALLGDALLTPTRIYSKSILALGQAVIPTGICKVADGGLYGSLPLSLPDGLGARIERSKLEIPPIFSVIQKVGHLSEREMFGEFNMGIGMCVIVAQEDAATAVSLLAGQGERVSVIGEVKKDISGVMIV